MQVPSVEIFRFRYFFFEMLTQQVSLKKSSTELPEETLDNF